MVRRTPTTLDVFAAVSVWAVPAAAGLVAHLGLVSAEVAGPVAMGTVGLLGLVCCAAGGRRA